MAVACDHLNLIPDHHVVKGSVGLSLLYIWTTIFAFRKSFSDTSFLAYQNWSVNIKITKIDQ